MCQLQSLRMQQAHARTHTYAYIYNFPALCTIFLARPGEYLVYADAGAHLESPIHPLLMLLEAQVRFEPEIYLETNP